MGMEKKKRKSTRKTVKRIVRRAKRPGLTKMGAAADRAHLEELTARFMGGGIDATAARQLAKQMVRDRKRMA
jgi:hypothetical protein